MDGSEFEKYGSVSIVIPVFNSEESLAELLTTLTAELTHIAFSYEIVLVNDGSSDGSWNRIVELQSTMNHVIAIDLMRNYGQHNALLTGIRRASGEFIVTMDDDLQHPAVEIRTLLAKLREGFDVVYGAPIKEQHGLWRDMASVITKFVLEEAMGVGAASNTSAFRAFRSEIVNAFRRYKGPFVDIDALLTWGTTRFSVVRVPHDERRHGSSKYTLKKLVMHAVNMMTCFSVLPLQIASIIGFTFFLAGLVMLTWVLGRYFIQGSSVPGFVFLGCAVTALSGAQLFASGVIGEYLARIHFRIMGRPSSVVRQTLGARPAGEAKKD